MIKGAKGGDAASEAQARDDYFSFRSQVEESLRNVYDTEAKLRYMLGIAATDGRLIRPIDDPTTAKVTFDWCESNAECLARDVTLRQQKWVIKLRELELTASKNFLLPQLDAVGKYTWTGFGNKLIESSGGSGDIFSDNSNAFQSLTDGKLQSWELGFQFAMPIGFRREMSGVRNAQLQLAKDRAILQEKELEVSHLLSDALREMESSYVLSQTNFNRLLAARRRVEAVLAAYDTGTIEYDILSRAEQLLGQANRVYYDSMYSYNNAIAHVHYRKGSLLEYNGVYLAEGPWPGKAYFDARRRARARGRVDVPRLRLYPAQGHQPRPVRTTSRRLERIIRRQPAGHPRLQARRFVAAGTGAHARSATGRSRFTANPSHARRTQAPARSRGCGGQGAGEKIDYRTGNAGNRDCRLRLEKSVQDYAQAGDTTGRLPGSVGRARGQFRPK